MTEPVLEFVSCPDAQGLHRMAYHAWGDPQASHAVVCVHGLTRQGRDFDTLAQALIDQAKAQGLPPLRVICPDVVGRGKSDWLQDPLAYQIPQYAADMAALLGHLRQTSALQTIDWVGISMGGLIGLVLAAQELPLRMKHLVLNDVGPAIAWSSIQRMQQYVGQTGRFANLQEASDAMWQVSQSFGPHTPEAWLNLSRHMVRPLPDGAVTLHYDPALGQSVRKMTMEDAAAGEALLWQMYDQIKVPTLLIRGADSDLLSLETARAMGERGPKAQCVEFAGVGHAPTLIDPGQISAVQLFLSQSD
ncbi:MAG: alpha/beta hydrolase [Burkholderiales bacterium]|nr:alpha/beta hydrolase [Burkholderiales bacterium]